MKKIFYFIIISHFFIEGNCQFVDPKSKYLDSQLHLSVLLNNTLDMRRAWEIQTFRPSNINMMILDQITSAVTVNNPETIRGYKQLGINNIDEINLYSTTPNAPSKLTSYDYSNFNLPSVGTNYTWSGNLSLPTLKAFNNYSSSTNTPTLMHPVGIAPEINISLCGEKNNNHTITTDHVNYRCLRNHVVGNRDIDIILSPTNFYKFADILLDNQQNGARTVDDIDQNIRTALADKLFITHGGSNSTFYRSNNPDNDRYSNIYHYAYSNDESLKNNMIFVGKTNPAGSGVSTIGEETSDFLSVVALGRGINFPSRIINAQGEYTMEQTDLNRLENNNESVYIVGGVASILLGELKNFRPQTHNPRLVKALILSGADKFHFPELTYNIYDHGYGAVAKFYIAQRTNDRGHGSVNAYQSLLMAQSYVMNKPERIFTPTNTPVNEPLEMPYKKMLFNKYRTYGLSLNRHGISGYKLPNLNTYWAGSEVYSSYPEITFGANEDVNTTEIKGKYAKNLTLLGTELYLENIQGVRSWVVDVPFADRNRLLMGNCASRNFCGYNDGDLLIHSTENERNKHNQNVINGVHDSKLQRFELTDSNDPEGYYNEGDLVVVRTYPDSDGGESIEITDWSLRSGTINNADELRRHLLRKFSRNAQDDSDNNGFIDIRLNNSLNFNEYLHSPDNNFHLTMIDGFFVILEKDSEGIYSIEKWKKDYSGITREQSNIQIIENTEQTFLQITKKSDGTLIDNIGENCKSPETGSPQFILGSDGIGRMYSSSGLIIFSTKNSDEEFCHYLGNNMNINANMQEGQYFLSPDKSHMSILTKNANGQSVLRTFKKENGKYETLVSDFVL